MRARFTMVDRWIRAVAEALGVRKGAGVRLERGAAGSPLTRERHRWEVGLGLAWRL
jgi:hypothetical protein